MLTSPLQHKGLIGVLDGFIPFGAAQTFVKGASFGAGQAIGKRLLEGHVDPFTCEVLSGGFGGGVQGLVMSPLLLLKTRVMTMPEMRSAGGGWATAVASSRLGLEVVRREGFSGLMKGSAVFSAKRVADWTTRFFFAEVMSDMLKDRKERTEGHRRLDGFEHSIASLAGGALSATATLPIDVVVATMQSASKAGQKVSLVDVWREQLQQNGLSGLLRVSCLCISLSLSLSISSTLAVVMSLVLPTSPPQL